MLLLPDLDKVYTATAAGLKSSLLVVGDGISKRNEEWVHSSKIWGLLQKKMYMGFLARYQIFNISFAKIH